MKRSSLRIAWLALLTLVVGATATALAADKYAGSDKCADCHDEIAAQFRKTPHAVAPGWSETHGCESCHGPGAAHIAGEGDATKIVVPTKLTPAESSKICLECHVRNKTNFAHESNLHNLADVACVDCHDPHKASEKMLRRQGNELCATCHQIQVSQLTLPRSHPLAKQAKDANVCVACHDPHSASSLRQLEGFDIDKCYECHFEKAGPYLYSHDVALVDGCQACHTIHGNSTRHLLKTQRMIDLCYQCHPGTTTPTFHNAVQFRNEKCTACHTAIHGSNTNEFFLEE
ncbi:MAG TPA: DmsE family decaheme c-type cytochrome [Candidatus Saccharimonadales bacterium]|nr:DmsE family decaheme c-type cytochrome [Candidatus Saccharimonadales bacterium]